MSHPDPVPRRQRLDDIATLFIRLSLGVIFIAAGLGQWSDYSASQDQLAILGLPSLLLPLSIVLDLIGGLALILGWQTRWTALAMAEYSVFNALMYHADMAWLLSGGLLLLAIHGSGRFALDCLAALCGRRRATPDGTTAESEHQDCVGCR